MNKLLFQGCLKSVIIALLLITMFPFTGPTRGEETGDPAQQETASTAQDELHVDDAFAKARSLAFDGKRQRAKRILKNLLKRKPNYTDIRVFLARVMAWDKEFEEARLQLDEVIKVKPFHHGTLRLYFDIEMWDKKPQKALDIAERYLKEHPDDHDFLYRKARSLYALDKKLESHLVLNHLLTLDPTYAQAHTLLTRVEDDFREAEGEERKRQRTPAEEENVQQEGEERKRQRTPAEEEKAQQKESDAPEIKRKGKPPSVNVMFNKARRYAFNGERQKSMDLLQAILTPKPNEHEIRVFLARVLAWEKEYVTARKELNYILSKRPYHRQSFQVYFDIEMWAKDPGKALEIAERYLDHLPGDEDFVYRRAKALRSLGRDTEAWELVEKILDENPEHERALKLREKIKKVLWPEPEEEQKEEKKPVDSQELDKSDRGEPPTLAEVYNQARSYAFNKERDRAKELLEEILRAKPRIKYVRTFLARVQAWDKEFEEGRDNLEIVLKENPFHKEALQVLYDIEMWDKRPHKALQITEAYLIMNPEDQEFRYRWAKVLNSLEHKEKAILVLEDLLAENPQHEDAGKLYDRLTGKKQEERRMGGLDVTREPDKVSVSYKREMFSKTFADWETISYSYSQKVGPVHNPWTLILRLNTATRFGKDGEQYEIDMYPKICDGTYAYLNFGLSSDSIFPEQRYGFEVYQSLPGSFEFSLGLRHLIFSSSTVTIYTAALGHYFGSYWVSLRTYHTPKDVGSSNSWNLTLRQYLWGGDCHLEFSGGFGSSPDDDYSSDLIAELKSEKWGVALKRRLRSEQYFSLGYSHDREEVREGEYRTKETYSIGLEHRL